MFRFTAKERIGSRLNRLPLAIYDAFPAVLFGRVLVVAVRSGLFDALAASPLTAGELASRVKLSPEPLRLMLPALTQAGYLKEAAVKAGEKFRLTPQSRKWLVRSSPHYLGNFLEYIGILHSHWLYIGETLEEGRPPKSYVDSFTPSEWMTYTLGMMDLARLIMPHLAGKLKLHASAKRLLDVGGSHGLYSIECCRRLPELHATVVDLPQVLETTRAVVAANHMEARISLAPGDLRDSRVWGDLRGGKFDVVLVFNIVHGFDEESNRRILSGLADSMTAGGTLYILDQFVGKGRGVTSLLPLMVGLNLLNEIGGTAYSAESVSGWCVAAGFESVSVLPLSLPGVTMISATIK